MSSIQVRLQRLPILREKVLEELEHPSSHGAQTWFFGIVRDLNLGKRVFAVSYDAYIPLAEKTLRVICEEAQVKFGPGLSLLVLHRVGRVEVGEVSVAIGVSSPHRDEAYLASRHIIENIKHRAPIWKKEHYPDGETEWLEGHALCGKKHHDSHSQDNSLSSP